MITIIHEHSVDPDLLPAKANILDLGCLGFAFTRHFRGLGHNVKAVDIQELGEEDDYQVFAVSDTNSIVYIVTSPDRQAFRIQKSPPTDIVMNCITLDRLSAYYDIEFWDLIKMDIESSEYQVIMSLEKAPAKQLSIEFHLHCGQYGMPEMTMMEDKLKALGYEAVSHMMEPRHGAGQNYWDSLFILK